MLSNILQTIKYTPGSFEFGEIEELEYESVGEEKPAAVTEDDHEAPTEEELTQQDIQYTGYVKVRLYTDNTIVRATYLMPLSGRSMFFGGMPERGSVCFMVNMKGDMSTGAPGARVIIGFMPVPINMMITARKELEQLKEGEIKIQSSSYDEHTKDFYSGASAFFDIYGRLIIESGDDDFQIIVGDLLSNEYTDDVDVVKDPITGETICFRESYKKNKYSRSVDKAGNSIYRILSEIWDIAGDSIRRIDGQFIVATGEDIKLESRGSFMTITNEGCKVSSARKIFFNSVGSGEFNAGGYLALSSFLDLSMTSSSGIVGKCLKEMLLSAGKQITISSAQAKILLKAFTDVEIKATNNFNWEATLNAVIKANVNTTLEAGIALELKGGVTATVEAPQIKIGAGASVEPMVKGLTLQTDLLSHLHLGNLGFPTSPPPSASPAAFQKILSVKTVVE